MKKYLVYLNVLAAFAVVILHTNFVFWYFSYESYWVNANVIESLFYFAVPLFVMMTGANLIGYSEKYSTTQYVNKRIEKVVLPFLIWTGIAHIISLYKTPDNMATWQLSIVKQQFKWIVLCVLLIVIYIISKKFVHYQIIPIVLKLMAALIGLVTVIKIVDVKAGSVWEILNNIFHTQYQSVYWYFIPLFALYIAIPMLEGIPETSRQKVFGSIISMTFIFGYLVVFILQFLPNMTYNTNLVLPFQTYIWYALVGYYIDHYVIPKHYRYIIYAFGLIGLSMILFGTQIASFQQGAISLLFKDYLKVPTMLYSVAIFVFFKYLPDKIYNGLFWKLSLKLSKTTFGIYLIHILLIEMLRHTTTLDFKQLSVRLSMSVLIFIGSALLVAIYLSITGYIKKKIKYNKNV